MSRSKPTMTTKTTAKRTSKQAQEEAEANPIIRTEYELWDADSVKHCLRLLSMDEQSAIKLRIVDTYAQRGKLHVDYRYKLGSNRKWGRLYASGGYQGLKKTWRRLLAHKYYHDIDVANCHFEILEQMCDAQQIPCVVLKQINRHRGKFLMLGNRDKIKRTLIITEFLGDAFMPEMPHATTEQKSEFQKLLTELKKEIKLICADLFHRAAFKDEREAATGEKEKQNELGSFLALVLQRRESDICCAMADFFKQKGRKIGTLIFDGCLLERTTAVGDAFEQGPIDAQLLAGAENYVLQQTRFAIKLVEKSLEPTPEDWALWNGKEDLEMMEGYERLTYLLTQYAKEHGLARMDARVMVPHPTIVGVFIQSDLEMEEWINQRLLNDRVFKEKNYKPDLLKWFQQNDHKDFPIVSEQRSDRYLVAFNNKYYVDLTTMRAMTLAEFENEHKRRPVTFHWYDVPFSASLVQQPTPNWDKLIRTQFGAFAGLVVFFEVMVGRLLFPTKMLDNWQIMMMLIGDANTGKSTIIDAILKLFPKGTVGPITANQEAVFGLQDMEKKRLVVCPDIPQNLSKIFPQTLFQSMVSGDPVSVPQKQKTALKIDCWPTPLLFAGNYWPDYGDNSGAISRRYAAFSLRVLVTERDTQLLQKLEQEVPTILLRCATRYHEKVAQDVDKVDIWKQMPQALIDMQEEVKEQTNPLFRFLTNGDKYYEVMYEKGAKTNLADFQKALRGYMTSERLEYKWTNDLHPLKAKGYVIDVLQICKSCGNKALKGCCERYDAKNRKKVTIIQNMKLARKDQFAPTSPASTHRGSEHNEEAVKQSHSGAAGVQEQKSAKVGVIERKILSSQNRQP